MIEFLGAPNPAHEAAQKPGSNRGYLAAPQTDSGPGVLALHAWWGLNDTFKAFADRLAVEGFTVLAPDMFGGKVASTIDEADRLSSSAGDEGPEQAVLGAADELERRAGAPFATLGFSYGAAYALWLAKKRPDQVRAALVYYGTYQGVGGQAPVCGHFAADDAYEPADNVDAFESELREAGRQPEFHRYPGTKHWFAEPDRPEYDAEAAGLAWTRTLEFLRRQLG